LHCAVTECYSPTYQGNHETSEACPLVDAARKWKTYKWSQKEKYKNHKNKINNGKKKQLKKSQMSRS